MSDRPQLDRTAHLLQGLINWQADTVSEFAPVLAALQAGRTEIVIDLPWYPDGGTHQLVLTGLRGDRILCLDALGPEDAPVGSILPAGGIVRRAEEGGLQSVLLSDLEACFASGEVRALIPR